MSFRNWLDKGFYIEDEYGDLNKTDDKSLATHYHDGYSLSKIQDIQNKKWKNENDDVNIFSHWKNENDDDDDDISLFSHWKD